MNIHFIEPGGETRAVAAGEEESVMRLALSHGVPGILAECGGVLACATCHVIVEEAWIDRLPPPAAAEEEMLECVGERLPGSRLCCQLKLEDVPHGLTVRIPESQF